MSNILRRGQTLHRGKELVSYSGKVRAVMKQDGNFVLFSDTDKELWSTNTSGKGDRLKMQHDGNLVIFDRNNKPTWSSNTQFTGHFLWMYLFLNFKSNISNNISFKLF
jgi:hypothetical protein